MMGIGWPTIKNLGGKGLVSELPVVWLGQTSKLVGFYKVQIASKGYY